MVVFRHGLGSAINQISIAIFGYDNVALFFGILFQVLQIILSVKSSGYQMVENERRVVCAMLYICSLYTSPSMGILSRIKSDQ